MSTQYQFGIRLAVEGTQQVVDETDKASQGFSNMGREADRGANIANGLLTKLKGLAVAYVGTETIRQFIETADAMNLLDGRLKSVIGTGANYRQAQEDIYRIAQANNIALADTTTLYIKLYDPITRLGGNTKQVADITDAFSRALRISGATTAEASSATLQFAQAMGSGILRGEEFNSITEAAPRVIRALADSLGVSTGELRKMAEQGELTADVVGRALVGQLSALRQESDKLPDTVGGAFTRLKNDASLLVREFDDTAGATGLLARGIGGLADGVGFLAKELVAFNGSAPLRQAAEDVNDLHRRATILRNGMEAGFYGPNFQKELDETNAKLVIARQRFRELDQQLGGVTATQEGMIIQGKERERVTRMLAEADKSLDGIRQQLSGTDKNYIPTLNELQRLRELGTIGEKEYVDLVTQLAEKNYKKSASTKVVAESDREAKKAADELAAIDKRRGEVLVELSGYSRDYATRTGDLAALYAAGKITLEQLTAAHDALLAKQPAMIAQTKAQADATRDGIEAAKARNAEFDVAFDKIERERLATEGQIGAARTMLERIEYETAAVKMSNVERAISTAERDLERQGVVRGTLAYDAYIEKIRAAVVRKEDVDKSITENKRLEEESKRSAQAIQQGLTDSLFRAFESGGKFFSVLWDGVKNTIKTTILQPLIADISKPFLSFFSTVVDDVARTVLRPTIATDGITSFLSTLWNGLTSILGSFSSGLGSVMSGIGSAVGGLFGGGSSGGGALGAAGSIASLGGTAANGGLLGNVGALFGGEFGVFGGGAMSGIGGALAAAAPWALGISAALSIANSLFGDRGGPKVSGLANTGGFADIPAGGAGDSAAAQILQGLTSQYGAYTEALGGTAGNLTGAAFFAKDPQGNAATQLVLDAKLNGTEIFSRNNRTSGGNVEDVGRSDQEFANAVAEAQTRALLASLQATTYSDANIASQIAAINAGGSAEQISSQIQAIAAAEQQRRQQAAAAAQQAQQPQTAPAWAGTGGAIGVTAQVSTEVLDLYARTAAAAERTVAAIYESGTDVGNRIRGPIYEVNVNIDMMRAKFDDMIAALREELQLVRVQIYNTEQVLLGPARESADALAGSSRGGLPLLTRTA
jgi:tape measure domain-containing protein